MATPWHLEPDDMASLLDGNATAAARGRIEAHLAECAECRRELVQLDDIARTVPARRSRWLVPLAATAAAAAVLLVIVVPRAGRDGDNEPVRHREPAVSATAAPVTLSPRGVVAAVDTLRWSRVPGADRYRMAIYDAGGTLVWEVTTADTGAAFPDSVTLEPGRPYFWSVRARAGYERWSESGLTRFRLPPRDTVLP
jgi:anti-sigma factor RsiW